MYAPTVASPLRVRCLQYGDPMAIENSFRQRGRAEEWLAPGFFSPQTGGGLSIDGRETVPNPFPIVPQARRRTAGLGAAARTAMLAHAQSDHYVRQRRKQRPGPFLSQLAAAADREYALEGQAVADAFAPVST